MNPNFDSIVNDIIQACIDYDVVFGLDDVAIEAIARGCKLSRYSYERLIKDYKYPLYYKCHTVLKDGKEYPIMYPADKSPNSYEFPDISNIKYPIESTKVPTHNEQRTIFSKVKELFDKRGRYAVSATKVKEAGFHAGDYVYVLKGNRETISITNDQKFSIYAITKLKVDDYFNIRLTRSLINKCMGTPNVRIAETRSRHGLIELLTII